MIFRKAEKEDFYKIRSLYWTLIDQEQDDPSFPHWKKGIHPSDEMIQDSIDTRQLYVLSDDEKIAACVIANDEKVDGYSDAPWQIDSDEVIVLHVLAVHPDYRGKGLARRLVENVIEQERKADKKALRLDVIENNTTAEKLYQKLGFTDDDDQRIDTILDVENQRQSLKELAEKYTSIRRKDYLEWRIRLEDEMTKAEEK